MKKAADILVEALELGRYIQARGKLSNVEDYCCLGVLCDLSMEHTGIAWDGESFDTMSDALPESVMEWADMWTYNGYIMNLDRSEPFHSLSELNDSGKSFVELAEITRNNWRDL